jgi:PAS domain S-box-containing protein
MNIPYHNRLFSMLSSLFRSKKKISGIGSLYERRFWALLNNGSEIITLLDANYRPVFRSPASQRLTGWSLEERQKYGLINLTHPDDVGHLRQALQNALDHPGEQFRVSFRTLHRDGNYIWLEGSMVNYLADEAIQAIVANLHDVTESKERSRKLQESHEQLRLLASHLQDIREEERTSMAREIHDELGQLLTGLKMDVSWLNRRPDLNEEAAREKIKGILTLLDQTVNTVRRLAAELRPSILDDLGLPEALGWYSNQFAQRSGIQTSVDIEGERRYIPKEVATGLYRIYQEALTNVARHAKATKVKGVLNMDASNIVLTVADDGKGFDVERIGAKKTLGLLGMQERVLMMGGKFNLQSHPDQGTTIEVSVPLTSTEPETL